MHIYSEPTTLTNKIRRGGNKKLGMGGGDKVIIVYTVKGGNTVLLFHGDVGLLNKQVEYKRGLSRTRTY